MALPGRAFYTLQEAAAKWDCNPTDIVEWGTLGHIKLVTSTPVVVVEGEKMAGLVEVYPVDLLPAFRRDGSGPEKCEVHRIKPADDAEAEWRFVDPDSALMVPKADVLISSAEVYKFATENGLLKQPSYRTAHYDWDGMFVQVCVRIYEEGIPDNLQELIKEMEAWFFRRSDGQKAPDLSAIRRKLRPIWERLKSDA